MQRDELMKADLFSEVLLVASVVLLLLPVLITLVLGVDHYLSLP